MHQTPLSQTIISIQCNETYLRINIQNTSPSRLAHLPHSLHARPIQILAELGMLDEPAGVDEREEVRARDEVVVLAGDLGGAGGAGRVCSDKLRVGISSVRG